MTELVFMFTASPFRKISAPEGFELTDMLAASLIPTKRREMNVASRRRRIRMVCPLEDLPVLPHGMFSFPPVLLQEKGLGKRHTTLLR